MAAPVDRRRTWLLGGLSALLIAVALAALGLLGERALPDRAGPPIEELAVEHTLLSPGTIELTVRNAGPDPVTVAQVFVNDVYVDFTGPEGPLDRLESATYALDVPWQDGQPYAISMLTSTGLVIEHTIAAAVETPEPGASFFGLMALLGTYVGIVPILLGMLLLPVLRTASARALQLLLGFTVGLLAFLAVDGFGEASELGEASGGVFGGAELVTLGAVAAFLALTGVDRYLRDRRSDTTSAVSLAIMIALGIGLHNFGEGLAIGSAYAIGELALGASLIVGFALHNTTEGVAIVAPLAKSGRSSLLLLAGLGLLAGAPAILGAVVGATVNNSELSALLLGIGVGAIVQVVAQIAPSLRRPDGAGVSAATIAAVVAGIAVMYVTGLAVPA